MGKKRNLKSYYVELPKQWLDKVTKKKSKVDINRNYKGNINNEVGSITVTVGIQDTSVKQDGMTLCLHVDIMQNKDILVKPLCAQTLVQNMQHKGGNEEEDHGGRNKASVKLPLGEAGALLHLEITFRGIRNSPSSFSSLFLIHFYFFYF